MARDRPLALRDALPCADAPARLGPLSRRRKPEPGLRPTAFGAVAAAVATAALHGAMEREDALLVLAVFLGLTAASYPGALLAIHAGRGDTLSELVIGAATFGCAVAGGILSPLWLVVGYALHGAWDWLHHSGHVRTRVVAWFPPTCAAVDIVAAVMIVLLLV